MWRKSSYCDTSACVEVAYVTSSHCAGGDCVEVGFRTSTRCDAFDCVEVGICPCDGAHVRDSKDPTGPVLTFDPESWRALLAGIKAGELSIP